MSSRLVSQRFVSFGSLLVLSILIALSTPGCRTAPIKDIGPAQVGVRASKDQVKKAIFDAGSSLGWVMKEKSPGLIVGNLALRDHLAVVEIPYSSASYSIRYQNSRNLKYNATDKTIHSNYNGWVDTLDTAIRAQLSGI